MFCLRSWPIFGKSICSERYEKNGLYRTYLNKTRPIISIVDLGILNLIHIRPVVYFPSARHFCLNFEDENFDLKPLRIISFFKALRKNFKT